MKLIVVIAVVALAALAAAAPAEEPVAILRTTNEASPDGSFRNGYETSNGIIFEQQGSLKQAVDEDNKPRPVVVYRGSFSFPDEDGKPITVTYEADENGYRAIGDHIPARR